jgi:hypothetical protein
MATQSRLSSPNGAKRWSDGVGSRSKLDWRRTAYRSRRKDNCRSQWSFVGGMSQKQRKQEANSARESRIVASARSSMAGVREADEAEEGIDKLDRAKPTPQAPCWRLERSLR